MCMVKANIIGRPKTYIMIQINRAKGTENALVN